MKFTLIFKILGFLLMLMSLTMLPPIFVSYLYHDQQIRPFLISFIISLCVGLFLWFPARHAKDELRTRDGFIIVVLIWLTLASIGSIPYLFTTAIHLPLTQAFFESMSGFTTTGATIIEHLDNLPHSLLFYRQQSQFLGGMGIIILAVAILPMIGVGGMQLYRAEANGPWKDTKLTPHIMTTAKALWGIYITLTILCVIAYYACGMNLFNAISYAFATIGTGGFAPHDASIAYFHSHLIYCVTMIFMIASASSFALHFTALNNFSLKTYWKDPEFKIYIKYIFIMCVIMSTLLIMAAEYHKHNFTALIEACFQVISFATNTGFTIGNQYASWPLFAPILLTIIGLIGGCAGSTSGGLKMIRAILIRMLTFREMKKLIHPNGIFPIKIGTRVLSEGVINSVLGFMSAYLFIFIFLWLCIICTNMEPLTAFSAIAACLSNVGPGLGGISINYASLPSSAHWILSIAMLIGRLEVFTVLVLFMPEFWRK